MSKKDYIKFAEMLHGQEPVRHDLESDDAFCGRRDTWIAIVRATAEIFQSDNLLFDRPRFEHAVYGY